MAAVLPSQALLTRFTVFRHRHPRHLLIIIGTPRRRSGTRQTAGFPVWHALALGHVAASSQRARNDHTRGPG